MWFVCGCASQAIADEAMTPAAFVRQYCLDCHSGPDAENGFDMERLSPLPRQPAEGHPGLYYPELPPYPVIAR